MKNDALSLITKISSDDEEEEEENAGPTRIDMEVARCRANLGEEGPYFVKMPNFLNVVSKKFDPETYEDEVEEDDALDEEGRRTRLKVKVSQLNNGAGTKKFDSNRPALTSQMILSIKYPPPPENFKKKFLKNFQLLFLKNFQ